MGARYCSYRVGGPLDEPYLPKNIQETLDLLSLAQERGCRLAVIGGGANTLIASRGIRGITLLCKRLMSIEQLGEHTFRIGAGLPLARISTLAQERSLTGAEFMIGIPGTLGGAIVMNAGAMGQETSNLVNSALMYNRDSGEMETWSREQLAFSYRKSAVDPDRMVVLGAELSFSPGDPATIAEHVQKSLLFRQKHHPKEPNGGSVFKNPAPDRPAGFLLDEAGAKGWQEGGAMISLRHANFIVNRGGATSTDILRLMLRMKRLIHERYGLDAFPENRFIGDATEEEQSIWGELTGHAWNHG